MTMTMTSYIGLIDGKAGAYGVAFPDLPGCTAKGATVELAFANARDALRDWVEVTLSKGTTVPAPRTIEELVAADQETSEAVGEGAEYRSIPLVRKTSHPA